MSGNTNKIFSINLCVAVIFLIGLFLRIHGLGSKSLWFDEAFTLLESKKAFPDLLHFDREGIHPPLYRLIMHFWLYLGKGETFIRIPSLLFSVFSIILIYKVAGLIFNKRVALYSALFMGISPFQIYYAQEVKMYSLLLFLCLVSIYFFLRVLKENKRVLWSGYVLFTALSIYTHYCAFLNIIAQNLFILFSCKRHKKLLPKWMLGQFLIILLFSPWFYSFGKHIERIKHQFWIPPVSFENALAVFKNFSLGYHSSNFNNNLLLFSFAIIFLCGIHSIISSIPPKGTRQEQKAHWGGKDQLILLLSYFVIPIIIILLISRIIKPIYMDRALISLSFFYYIILAKGLYSVKTNKIILGSIIISIVLLFGMVLKNYYSGKNFLQSVGVFEKKPLRELTEYIESRYSKGEVIVLSHQNLWASFEYYLPHDIRKEICLAADRSDADKDHSLFVLLNEPFNVKVADMENIAKETTGIWVVISGWGKDTRFVSPKLKEWMDAHVPTFKNNEFAGIEVCYFGNPRTNNRPL